jgi:hypothetical protein
MKLLATTIFIVGLAAAPAAEAAVYVVGAKANSSSGGVGADTVALSSGQTFTVSVAPNDLWSAGALPRWSNANGLTGNLFATGSDNSGEAAGTLIGQDFGLWTQHGLSAAYGSLVGEIGGVFKVLGTSFNGAAWGSGVLNLYYWDSNNADNAGAIDAFVTAGSPVPEPATWALMIGGFALAGQALRGRKRILPRAA